ncbi:MAG: hypothetical protein RLZZ383_1259 [Pseudomonadota bacterium]|jgi:hypothetical protein
MDPLTVAEVRSALCDDAGWDARHVGRLARARAARVQVAHGVWLRPLDRQGVFEACVAEARALGGAARLVEAGWIDRLVDAWNERLAPVGGTCGWWRVDAAGAGQLVVQGQQIDVAAGGGWWVSATGAAPIWLPAS